jgi:adenosylcobinamide kinase/adenosylcobinamide-phosphate guanylyltransferase
MEENKQKSTIFITGGERSGKSRYAQDLALQSSASPVYLATARRWDRDFQSRIIRHQEYRDKGWKTLEEEKNISRFAFKGETVVLDCITLWMTNFFVDLNRDVAACLEMGKKEIDQLILQDARWIIVSNEIGMGVHAATEAGRKFAELQGWMNQYIAAKADQVIFMVSGIPVLIKKTSS